SYRRKLMQEAKTEIAAWKWAIAFVRAKRPGFSIDDQQQMIWKLLFPRFDWEDYNAMFHHMLELLQWVQARFNAWWDLRVDEMGPMRGPLGNTLLADAIARTPFRLIWTTDSSGNVVVL